MELRLYAGEPYYRYTIHKEFITSHRVENQCNWKLWCISLQFRERITKKVTCGINKSILPIGSMYGIFTYIWFKFMVNVGKYTIHGSYGLWLNFPSSIARANCWAEPYFYDGWNPWPRWCFFEGLWTPQGSPCGLLCPYLLLREVSLTEHFTVVYCCWFRNPAPPGM